MVKMYLIYIEDDKPMLFYVKECAEIFALLHNSKVSEVIIDK